MALDITDAANALAAEGHPVDQDDLATITPYIVGFRRKGGSRYPPRGRLLPVGCWQTFSICPHLTVPV